MPRGRVLIVIRLLAGRRGGAERVFCETANLLAEAGYQVTAAHCDSSDAPPEFPLGEGVTRVNLWERGSRRAPLYRVFDRLGAGYPEHATRAGFAWLSRNLYFVARLRRLIRRLRPDVIISFMPPSNTPSLIAGWLAGSPVIPTNHNVPEHDYRSPTRWDQNPIDRFLRGWTLRAAARIHVLFPGFVDGFPAALRPRIVDIPNFVSDEFLAPIAAGPRRRTVLAMGRLVEQKQYQCLIDAWALLAPRYPDWSVTIHGDGPLRPQLEQQVRDLGLAGSVKLAGDTTDPAAACRQAEIFCHPARFEGFGLAVAEALACGLPVVAFRDCPGVCELVEDGDNGLLADGSGDPAALAAALGRLIDDAALRERLRARAAESVRGFSRQAYQARWTALIDRVIAEAAG